MIIPTIINTTVITPTTIIRTLELKIEPTEPRPAKGFQVASTAAWNVSASLYD
jgi:hypothetical protein